MTRWVRVYVQETVDSPGMRDTLALRRCGHERGDGVLFDLYQVHRLTPSDESGAQKVGTNRFDKSLQGLSARASREDSATGGERPAHFDILSLTKGGQHGHEHTTTDRFVRYREAEGGFPHATDEAVKHEDEEDGLKGAPSPLQCAEEHPEAGAKAQIGAFTRFMPTIPDEPRQPDAVCG